MSIFKNFYIDRILDLTQYDRTTNEMQILMPEVSDLSISVTTNEDEITDATGSPVAILESAKQATLSGNGAFYNFDLLASQAAATSDTANIAMPYMEIVTVADGAATLGHAPVGESGAEIGYVYVRNTDGTQGTALTQGAEAAEGVFALRGTDLTFDSSMNGKQIYVPYTYTASSGMHFENQDDNFTTSAKVIVRALVRDICDDNKVSILVIVSENAKLASSFDITLARGEQHAFEYRILPAFCGASGKSLYHMYLLDTDDYVAE